MELAEPEPALARPRPSRARRLLPYALIALSYVATWPYHAGLNNPNELVRVYMTKSLVEDGAWSIDPAVAEFGYVDDKAIREGRLYSSKAPFQSLTGVPGYALAHALDPTLGEDKRRLTVLLRFVGALPIGLGFALFVFGWCRRRAAALTLPAPLGDAVGLGLALGTMLFPYGFTFSGHGLAAAFAGGAHFALVAALRGETPIQRFRAAVALGALAGATPFAEYPAALVALPAALALPAADALARAGRRLSAGLAGLAVGGLPPFLLGLYAHQAMWGSPWRNGYAFLENKAYAELVGAGVFGIAGPRLEAFAGALFSPGTGLFFFSPILALGVLGLARAALRPSPESTSLPRAAALAGLVAFAAEVLFISSYGGWRGGWTLGPRYIVALAPLAGLWVLEAAARRSLRPWIAGTAAASIVLTGASAALYPHLSDVYTNPIAAFVWPSYLAGYGSYGLAHALGLSGHAANLVHLAPLGVAASLCLAAAPLDPTRARLRHAPAAVVAAAILLAVALIPERDPAAAERENARLWGFWEPARPAEAVPGRILRLSETPARARVTLHDGARAIPCRPTPERPGHCRYGREEWQRFGPEALDFGGARVPLLFLHPVAGRTVRLELPIPAGARRARLRVGLTDASFASGSASPVDLTIADVAPGEGPSAVERVALADGPGLETLERPVAAGQTLRLELTTERDGARVVGLELELFE